jgi:hypothetical protein
MLARILDVIRFSNLSAKGTPSWVEPDDLAACFGIGFDDTA